MGPDIVIKDLRNSAGPVALAYETNAYAISLIIGPTAGGKTESSVRRILRIARSQHPSPKDGVRKCRIVCVGNTYRDLWDKAIPSYLKVFNKKFGEWQGGKGDPASHTMDFIQYEPQPDGSILAVPLHIEVWFRAKAGDQSLEDFVRGLECTAWWLQEMDQLPEAVLSLTSNRVGRYPEPDDRHDPDYVRAMGWPPAFIGVWGDTNMPVVDSWLYNKAFVEKAFGPALFLQPEALLADGQVNPRAENLHNLRKIREDYYPWLASTMESYDVDRLLRLKKSFDRRGLPVYAAYYVETRHVIEDIQIDYNAPLVIGLDTGNTLKHAATFAQPRRDGGASFVDEISACNVQRNLEEFCELLVQKVKMRFSRIRDITVRADPAAGARMTVAGRADRDIKYYQYIAALTGLDVQPADTNDPGLRRTSFSSLLKKEPGIWISGARCPDLVAGLGGGYSFSKIGDSVSPNVIKNDYSHVCEAAEYTTLTLNGASIFWGPSTNSDADNDRDYDQQPQASGY